MENREKYKKVSKKDKKEEIKPNEIRITANGKTRNYISYATQLFNEKKVTV